MKEQYNMNVSLKCITCGGGEFDCNDDKSYIKCKLCNYEYHGGYDELVEMNQETIGQALELKKNEIAQDLKEDITKKLRDAFRGNKYIKFK